MDIDLYFELIKKQQDAITPQMREAIAEQTRLHEIAESKRTRLYSLDDESIELLQAGSQKLISKYPELQNVFECDDIKINIMRRICEQAADNSIEFRDIVSKVNEIPELCKNSEMIDDIANACYEYIIAFGDLEERISADRQQLFSEQYKTKIGELANDGVFLYFLETPDLPLLEPECDGSFILDTFAFNNCENMKILLNPFVWGENVSPSMKRKGEDIYIAVELINGGFYRTALRNIFALLDSEHKKGAYAFDGIAYKIKQLKNGQQRAGRISKLVDRLGDEWMQQAWLKVNDYFKKVTSTSPVSNVPHRNSIVHGDYNSNLIDASEQDAVKILLLWLNMRLIVDYLCNLNEVYEYFLLYLPTIATKIIGGGEE